METKKVKQIDPVNGEVINIFSSLTDASKYTGVSKATISYCINNKTKTGKGFIWQTVMDGKTGHYHMKVIEDITSEIYEKKRLEKKYQKMKKIYKNAKIRECLLCNKKFVSLDRYNRRCRKCSSEVEYSKDSHFIYKVATSSSTMEIINSSIP